MALQLGHALAGRAARVAGIEPATLLYSGLLLATTIVGQLLAFLGQILLHDASASRRSVLTVTS